MINSDRPAIGSPWRSGLEHTILQTLQQAIAENDGDRASPPAASERRALARASPPAETPRPPMPFSLGDVVEPANAAVVVTDADLDAPGPLIVYVNPAFSRMTGWELADVLGHSPTAKRRATWPRLYGGGDRRKPGW